mmetsp:Transcript_37464/g.69277  ORF Transcript_37464/g.69277 Transcript_37464/m.69277 type:complete len:227 (-) Transcript_37464:593-1273(-)
MCRRGTRRPLRYPGAMTGGTAAHTTTARTTRRETGSGRCSRREGEGPGPHRRPRPRRQRPETSLRRTAPLRHLPPASLRRDSRRPTALLTGPSAWATRRGPCRAGCGPGTRCRCRSRRRRRRRRQETPSGPLSTEVPPSPRKFPPRAAGSRAPPPPPKCRRRCPAPRAPPRRRRLLRRSRLGSSARGWKSCSTAPSRPWGNPIARPPLPCCFRHRWRTVASWAACR